MIANLFRGLMAGFVASTVLALLLLSKGFIPQLDTITMLDSVLRAFLATIGGRPFPKPVGGWLWYFVIIGTLWWGALYAVIEPILPGSRSWVKGMSFGVGATLFVMLMVMPLAGAGYFGMHLDLTQPLVTLAEHLIYGLILGVVYAGLSQTKSKL